MSFGSILFNVLKAGAGLYFSVKGKKPSLTELLPSVMSHILDAVGGVVEARGMTSKDQIDQWLSLVDAQTGSDLGALDLLKDLAPDKEEELFDGLIQVIRVYAYWKAGVPGYSQK